MRLLTLSALSALSLAARLASAQAPLTPPLPGALTRDLDARIASVMAKAISWRRDLHEHPELSYSEERTAGVVAAHLRTLGMEAQTNVGGTWSAIGVLRVGTTGMLK